MDLRPAAPLRGRLHRGLGAPGLLRVSHSIWASFYAPSPVPLFSFISFPGRAGKRSWEKEIVRLKDSSLSQNGTRSCYHPSAYMLASTAQLGEGPSQSHVVLVARRLLGERRERGCSESGCYVAQLALLW